MVSTNDEACVVITSDGDGVLSINDAGIVVRTSDR